MTISSKIKPTHLQRRAYVYLRQSTQKQVQENTESTVNQRAMKERLLSFGWKPDQIVIVDSDLGCSGSEATARAGFQLLVTEVSLGRVGVVMGYDVSRLARNCRDWYHLIEICSIFDTLIADTDGVYHPSDFNDRLLLGLKGTMSEAELHSLRLRLDAGRLSKAKRGELVQHLPTGLVRTESGVVRDPDVHIQKTIRLVFEKFLELGSIRKTLIFFVRKEIKLPRRQVSGLEAGNVIWKAPSAAALGSILANPGYAGAFVYGRRRGDPRRQVPGRPSTGRIRRVRDEWLCVVKDAYPAYVSWDIFEEVQQRIATNRQKYEEHMRHKGAERHGAALLQGLVACRHCGRQMMLRYRENRRNYEYVCAAMQSGYLMKPCQHISGRMIDDAVVREFMSALSQAHIDGLARVEEKQCQEHRQLVAQFEREAARCEYEARLAEKQYNKVDPDNRLVAGTLEKRWEEKLLQLQAARQRLEDEKANIASQSVRALTPELRKAFLDIGRNLPALWPKLNNPRRKELLRTLIRQVHLHKRRNEGEVEVRIVWIGDHVTDLVVDVPALTRKGGQKERELLAEVRRLEERGMGDEKIAKELNDRGIRTCRQCTFNRGTVQQLRLRHGALSPLETARRDGVPGFYKVPDLAPLVPIDPTRIYRLISAGRIRIEPDPTYKCYLFEKASKPIEMIRLLIRGEVEQVSFTRGASRWLS